MRSLSLTFLFPLLFAASAFSSPIVSNSGSTFVGREGADVFIEYRAEKAYLELTVTSELCNQSDRELLNGGCELMSNNTRAQLIGSYPMINSNGQNTKASIIWACKFKDVSKGDLVQVRTLCK